MMNAVGIALLCSAAILIASCTKHKPPYLMATFCVDDAGDLLEIKRVLSRIAQDKQMAVGDLSAETESGFRDIEKSGQNLNLDFPVINFRIWRTDGLGVTVGNLRQVPTQIALGFSRGSDESEAVQFMNVVIRELGKTWAVTRTPRGQGVTPLAECSE